MLHGCLFFATAVILSPVSLVIATDPQRSVMDLPIDAANVIQSYLDPIDAIRLVITLRNSLSPFGWTQVEYTQTTNAIHRHLMNPDCCSNAVIFDGHDWVALEHPTQPIPNDEWDCPYTGRVTVHQMTDLHHEVPTDFCETAQLHAWHLEALTRDGGATTWRICNFCNGGSKTIGYFERTWLLEDFMVVGLIGRKLVWLGYEDNLLSDDWEDFYVISEINLDHELDVENVGFRGQHYFGHDSIVEVQRNKDTLLITNTDGRTGVSTQIEAKLPESFRMHNYHLHVKGKWLLVTGQIRFGWKLLVIDTEDGSVKQRVPLMGLPHSVEISPQAEYALVSFRFDTLPIHLIHLDSPFNRLTIVPGSFGHGSPMWLTHELFKMAITSEGIRYYGVRSAAHPSQNICEATSLDGPYYNADGEIDNGATMICAENLVCHPGIVDFEHEEPVMVDWETIQTI